MAIFGPLELPVELFCGNILLPHLEFSQIARCRAVCRNWRALIDSDSCAITALESAQKIWTHLSKIPKITVSLPPELKIVPMNLFPFRGSWAVETVGRNCYLLPNKYLGPGQLSLCGSALVRTTRDRVALFTTAGIYKVMPKACMEIQGERLLVITPQQLAKLYDSEANLLMTIENDVKIARILTDDKLLTYRTFEQTLNIFDVSTQTKVFERKDVVGFYLTPKGQFAYERNAQLFCHGDQLILDKLGNRHLSWADDGVVFLHDEKTKQSSIFSLTNGPEKNIEIPVDEEECFFIKCIQNCTLFVAHTRPDHLDATTTMVFDRERYDLRAKAHYRDRIRVELPYCIVPCFTRDDFIWLLGPRGLIYDAQSGYMLPFPRLANSFVSGDNLISVNGNELSVQSVEGMFI